MTYATLKQSNVIAEVKCSAKPLPTRVEMMYATLEQSNVIAEVKSPARPLPMSRNDVMIR